MLSLASASSAAPTRGREPRTAASDRLQAVAARTTASRRRGSTTSWHLRTLADLRRRAARECALARRRPRPSAAPARPVPGQARLARSESRRSPRRSARAAGRRRNARRPRSRRASRPGSRWSKRWAPPIGANASSAPQSSNVGTPSSPSLPCVGLELLEVHRAVELERRRWPRPWLERPPVRLDPARRTCAVGGAAGREAVAVERADQLLALLAAHRLGHAVPAAVAEEARVADHQGRDQVRVPAGPGEADEPAPVVDDQRDPPQPELVMDGAQRLEVALERRRPGVARVPEA